MPKQTNTNALRKEFKGVKIAKGSRADIAGDPDEVIQRILLMMRPMTDLAAFETLATCMEFMLLEMTDKERDKAAKRAGRIVDLVDSYLEAA